MNYITLINNFWERHKTNPVSTGAVSLFFALANEANRAMWALPLTVTNIYLQAHLHISKNSFLRYRNELSENGYISYEYVSSMVGSSYRFIITGSRAEGKKETDCGAGCGADSEPNKGLSTYNIKHKTINKDLKQNAQENNSEIFDSGRYDYDAIARTARKKIRESLADE